MHLHPYVRIALGAALIVLSATMIFSPSPEEDQRPTVTANAGASAAKTNDRIDAIKFFRGQ